MQKSGSSECTKARAVSSRVKKREREGGRGRRKEMEKKKKKYGKKHELKSRATDNELSGSARFAQKSNG